MLIELEGSFLIFVQYVKTNTIYTELSDVINANTSLIDIKIKPRKFSSFQKKKN